MIKLITAALIMVLSYNLSAQTDTITDQGIIPNVKYPLNKMRQDTVPMRKYTTGMFRDTNPNGTFSNRSNFDTLFNSRYNSVVTNRKYNSKMYGDTIPHTDMKHYKMGNMPRKKHVMMQNGKMIMMRNGKMTVLQNYTNLNNGTRAMRDGSIIKKDGTTTTLQEGECVNMAGEVMIMPMK